MECDEFKKRILLFLEGVLGEYELEEFSDHMAACRECETVMLDRARKASVEKD